MGPFVRPQDAEQQLLESMAHLPNGNGAASGTRERRERERERERERKNKRNERCGTPKPGTKQAGSSSWHTSMTKSILISVCRYDEHRTSQKTNKSWKRSVGEAASHIAHRTAYRTIPIQTKPTLGVQQSDNRE